MNRTKAGNYYNNLSFIMLIKLHQLIYYCFSQNLLWNPKVSKNTSSETLLYVNIIFIRDYAKFNKTTFCSISLKSLQK